MKKFNGVVFSGLDDKVEAVTIEAESMDEAYEKADEMRGTFEQWTLFTDEQWNNLKKVIKDA